MFLFSLKVTNFYRKSFGDDLLLMVAHGTNGYQWLPSTTVGCHRSVSHFTNGCRWENSQYKYEYVSPFFVLPPKYENEPQSSCPLWLTLSS